MRLYVDNVMNTERYRADSLSWINIFINFIIY